MLDDDPRYPLASLQPSSGEQHLRNIFIAYLFVITALQRRYSGSYKVAILTVYAALGPST